LVVFSPIVCGAVVVTWSVIPGGHFIIFSPFNWINPMAALNNKRFPWQLYLALSYDLFRRFRVISGFQVENHLSGLLACGAEFQRNRTDI
jgi:hypothetical protein